MNNEYVNNDNDPKSPVLYYEQLFLDQLRFLTPHGELVRVLPPIFQKSKELDIPNEHIDFFDATW